MTASHLHQGGVFSNTWKVDNRRYYDTGNTTGISDYESRYGILRDYSLSLTVDD